jgi:hypothetical protein
VQVHTHIHIYTILLELILTPKSIIVNKALIANSITFSCSKNKMGLQIKISGSNIVHVFFLPTNFQSNLTVHKVHT